MILKEDDSMGERENGYQEVEVYALHGVYQLGADFSTWITKV